MDYDKDTKEVVEMMKEMGEYPRQEILRYVRGISDGIAVSKRQYGLDSTSEAGRTA